MPNPQASVLQISSLQHEHLERTVRRSTTAQRLVKRGHIILAAARGNQQQPNCAALTDGLFFIVEDIQANISSAHSCHNALFLEDL